MAELIEHKNAAARLLYYIERASNTGGGNGNVPFVDFWAALLGVPSTRNPARKEHDVAELINAFLGQLDAVQTALLAQGIPESLVLDPTQRVANVMALSHMRSHWRELSPNLSPDILVSFRWFAHVLPKETHAFDAVAFEELAALLDELAAITQQETLPPALRRYLERVLKDIRTAMNFAPVVGVGPLSDAVRKTVMDAAVDHDDLKEALDKTAPETATKATAVVGKILKKGAEASGDIDKIAKAIKIAGDGVSWLMQQIP